jgi:hypothetical protein
VPTITNVDEGSSVGRCKLTGREARVEIAWFQRMKQACGELLTNIAFNFNLRHSTSVLDETVDAVRLAADLAAEAQLRFEHGRQDLMVGWC